MDADKLSAWSDLSAPIQTFAAAAFLAACAFAGGLGLADLIIWSIRQ